jgi:cytochrome c553
MPAEARPSPPTVCGACHGADGNSQLAVNPKLAGQHPEYLLKQMKNFKAAGRQAARARQCRHERHDRRL